MFVFVHLTLTEHEHKHIIKHIFFGKITSFVLYLNTILQAVSFSTNFDRFCPLQGILLHVLSFSTNLVRFSC
ncbi:hypothetical protein Hanom_Chr05g00473491 [Helianthus anomalus]